MNSRTVRTTIGGDLKLDFDRRQIRRWVNSAIRSGLRATGQTAPRECLIHLQFLSAQEQQELNRQYRGKAYATNVLTFTNVLPVPSSPSRLKQTDEHLQADICFCLQVISQEAKAQKKTVYDHLAHLVIHGCLHSLGFDHEKPEEASAMESLETRILARFRIADPYAVS
jgi:probable rRNA maturation factor